MKNYNRCSRLQLSALALMLLLVGCATPYQKRGELGGYEDQFIGNDKWHIKVHGNGFTSVSDLEQFFYRRAQEITQQNEYDGYKVEKIETEKNHQFGVLKPIVRGIILCYKGQPPTVDENSGQKKNETNLGTGWAVGGRYIVTNNHVIEGSSTVYLLSPAGKKVEAAVVVRDRANDLAILSVDPAQLKVPSLPLAMEQSGAGVKIFSVGYPHPTVMGAAPKVTDGIVSSTTGIQDDPRTYQISVPLQAGNSGGPILNMRGEVIGVATSKLNAAKVFKWTGDLPQNVNYAVKVQYLEPLIRPLIGQLQTGQIHSNKASTLEDLSKEVMRSVFIVVAK